MSNEHAEIISLLVSTPQCEMIARALYTLADANMREAKQRKYAGKENRNIRAILRADAKEASQLATVIYATVEP